jgi:hypothetical protein
VTVPLINNYSDISTVVFNIVQHVPIVSTLSGILKQLGGSGEGGVTMKFMINR